MEVKRRALGRGLGALLQPSPPSPEAAENPVREVPVERIAPNPLQPRRSFADDSLGELIESIRANGVLQPVLVRPRGDGYELIAGERRWRAARAAGLRCIPAVVRQADDREALELAIVENLQRDDLDPIEEAEAYHKLITEFGLTQDEVARRVGRSRPAVANAVRLLALPPEVRERIRDGSLSPGHGRALAALSSPADQRRLAAEAVRRGLNVRALEALVRDGRARTPPARAAEADPDREAMERDLARRLGTRVRLRLRGKGKGVLEITFHSLEELDGIVGRLAPGARQAWE